ncbi:methyltransferase-like protein 22 isoform X4 [Sagmatias obliquidens]|uniref:methyltransferase-like protein 22 isoform X4 n=1 Tax=Sagmatias obliquidens TaxID=3371155 RepID=UPI000F4454CD|nr:methyltransferase-like protein 22 isoform X4 [Lagenorhynchus obliquidens]
MVDGEPRPWLPSPAPAMDEITFKSDTVLSDVHLHTPNQRHLMVRLSGVGQPVFLSQFKLLWNQAPQTDSGAEGGNHRAHHAEATPPARSGCSSEGVSLQAGADATSQEGVAAQLDEDGDLDVVRRPRAASPSKPSGPPRDKVWRGALFLADYILSQRDLFQGRTVLELGAGTGLASILAATMAQTVYCTDVGADLLAMCQRNIALNSHLTAAGGGVIKVKELDWLKDDLCTGTFLFPVRCQLLSVCLGESWWPAEKGLNPRCPSPFTDPEVPFSWSEEDISDLYGHTTIVLAAEVFYDDDLTDALFKTLSRLAHRLKNASTAILSVEKRLNFTLRHLEVTCEAYDHFRSCLRRLEGLTGGRLRFAVEPVDVSFPQLLVYERIQQLELWKVFVEPVTEPIVSADTAS